MPGPAMRAAEAVIQKQLNEIKRLTEIAITGHTRYFATLRDPKDIARLKDRNKAVEFLKAEYPEMDLSQYERAQS